MNIESREACSRKVPSHEVTYARLRDMVLYGHLEPGAPVTIQGLTRDLEAGMTPVREAIRRLCAEGALALQGNRRVIVPRLTPQALEELAFARLTIEPNLAARAAGRITPDVLDTLVRLDAGIEPAIHAGDIPAYLAQNHAFHFALYAASDAPILTEIAQSLWLRFGPSLRVVCARYGTSGLPDRHAQALAALRAGDAAAASDAMAADIRDGVEMVRMAQAAGEV